MPQGVAPTPKVVAGGAAGASAIVLVYVAGVCGLEVPGEVGAAVATLISFAAAYLKA